MAEPKLQIELRIERLEAICEYFMALISPKETIDSVITKEKPQQESNPEVGEENERTNIFESNS